MAFQPMPEVPNPSPMEEESVASWEGARAEGLKAIWKPRGVIPHPSMAGKLLKAEMCMAIVFYFNPYSFNPWRYSRTRPIAG